MVAMAKKGWEMRRSKEPERNGWPQKVLRRGLSRNLEDLMSELWHSGMGGERVGGGVLRNMYVGVCRRPRCVRD